MSNPAKVKSFVDTLINHGDHVFSVTFRTKDRFPRFKPGQFLHLSIDAFDPISGYWPESRVFSIASRACKDSVKIIYCVKGKYTRRMESYLSIGSEVWLKFPYGDFIVDSKVKKEQAVVLIAGGTGITPFIPYLESEIEAGNPNRTLMLFYGVRKPELILIGDLLNECIKKLSHFNIELNIENNDCLSALANANIKKGVLNIKNIFHQSKSLNEPIYFISGPPAMINDFTEFLFTAGVARENIKSDEWE